MNVEICTNPNICNLDFRPELAVNHFRTLLDEGYTREEARSVISGIFDRDLLYQFWERFTKEKLVHFEYRLDGDKLLSPRYEALGDVINRLDSGITQRRIEGKSFSREEAEKEGMLKVKGEITRSDRNLYFLLYSPSPPDSELCDHPGYSKDYSFKFLGIYNSKVKVVDMYAIRHERGTDFQREEANAVAGGVYFSEEVHPNDFLRRPIFFDEKDFIRIKDLVADLPDENQLTEAKAKDFSKYAECIRQHADHLSRLIAQGASVSTLRTAQLEVEMDFTKWVSGGPVKVREFDDEVYKEADYKTYTQLVMDEFAIFATTYNTNRFACGSCGGSVLSLFSNVIEVSMPELFARYRPCPGCGESVRQGSVKCSSCGLTKAEYDAGQNQKKAA